MIRPAHLLVASTLAASILPAALLAGDTGGVERVKASPEACSLLDDPSVRGRMDGLLTKLLYMCGREDELGQVRQEVALEVIGDGPAIDVAVNDPTGDAGGSSHTQSETSLARSGTTGTICSGYNDSYHGVVQGQGFTGFSRSTDDGATFTDQGALGSNSGGDPSIVWRELDGNFYFTALENNGLGMWRSTDDCQTFAYLGNTHVSGGDDKEILVVDNDSGSPFYGRLYVGWTDFNDGRIYANYSDDGSTWSPAVALSGFNDVQGAWPAVAPNGDVYVGWIRWNPFPSGPIDVEIARSTDGGATFALVTNPMSGQVNPRDATATNNCFRPALGGNIRYLPSPQIAVGPDGVLHVVYSYDQDGFSTGDEVDVFYRRSTDGGTTWETEFQVNDDGTTNDQYFPTLAVSATNQVAVGFYDRRLDPSNLLIDYYQRISFDGGLNWEPSVRMSDVSTPAFLDPSLATCYHGDYDQTIATDTAAIFQWSDDRNVQDGHNDPDVFLEGVPLSTDFLLLPTPRSVSVCAPTDGVFTIDVPQFEGFSEMVTLSLGVLPPGLGADFGTNPVTPPGSSVLTLSNTGAVAAGSYDVDVVGTSGAIVHDTTVTLEVFDALPGAPGLVAPADTATDVALSPSFEWSAVPQAISYELEIASTAGFGTVVYSATVAGTTHDAAVSLDPVATYYWRVTPENVCGIGAASAAFSFSTRAIPPTLLVDDDDNSPNVRDFYTTVLGAQARGYDVWDTGNGDSEPTALDLAPYDVVLWFTGDEFGGAAGPGSAGEQALAEWLDTGNRCLVISSQDYHYDRGLTGFMQSYLGVSAVSNDTDQNTVTGASDAFSGLGPYALSYPFTDFSDVITPDGTAEVAFAGDQGNAGIQRAGASNSIFLVFPWEALPDAASREAVMDAIYGFCQQGLFLDGFESGNLSAWSFTLP